VNRRNPWAELRAAIDAVVPPPLKTEDDIDRQMLASGVHPRVVAESRRHVERTPIVPPGER
jgi:hypothetical protein